MKFKKVMRTLFLVFLVILAICGIPVASIIPRYRDDDDQVKTEIVEGQESEINEVDKT